MREDNRTLSVMIDESGDFDAPIEAGETRDRWYIVSLVLHDQTDRGTFPDFDRSDEIIGALNTASGLSADEPVHTGNLIRRERPYKKTDIRNRIALFDALVSFTEQCAGHAVHIETLVVDRARHVEEKRADGRFDVDAEGVKAAMHEALSLFIERNRPFFSKFETIRIYYDNGQKALSRIIHLAFENAFPYAAVPMPYPHPDFAPNVSQRRYRLLQVADMACTFTLLSRKVTDGGLSTSETIFFGGDKRKTVRAISRINAMAERISPLYDLE